METYEPTKEFDFSQIHLDTPQPVQGGTFFTKLLTSEGNPLYIQLPKCMSKQGVVTTKKNRYCDLLYDKENQEALIGWILSLEEHCQKHIYEKSDVWFHNDFTKEDIEALMTPVYRLYNAGKKLLVRTYIDVGRENKQHKCVVYDEREIQIDITRIMSHTNFIPLVMIEGVKFSSKSFDIVIKLSQVMVLDDVTESVHNCLIRRSKSGGNSRNDVSSTIHPILSVEAEPIITPPADDGEVLPPPAGEDEAVVAGEDEALVAGEDEAVVAREIEEATETREIEKFDETREVDASESQEIEWEKPGPEPSETLSMPIEASVEDNPVFNSGSGSDSGSGSFVDVNVDTLENVRLAEIADHDLVVSDGEPMNLRKPNEIYYEIYKAAKEKAIKMRRAAVEAYLETKEIKSKYMLQDIEDSDSDNDTVDSIYSDLEEP